MTRGVFEPFRRRKKPSVHSGHPENTDNFTNNRSKSHPQCSTCFDLNFAYIPQPHKDPAVCSIGQAARHWIASEDLSKNTGCKFCCFLSSAFDTLLRSVDLRNTAEDTVSYRIAIIDQRDEDDADASNAVDARDSPQRFPSLKVIMRCRAERNVTENKRGFDEEFEVEIFRPLQAPPSATWEAIGCAGEVESSPSIDKYANIARSWIDDCNENHHGCHLENASDDGGSILPRRVLDLADGQVRLVETTPGQRGRYVALSHCWGKEQLLITTRETLADRMAGIDMNIMPLTFQNAIQITKGLGIRYIWIDSLCIIQKDAQDWEEQSAVMADIYALCYLNIAATRAAGGHQGFLKPRYTRRDSIRWSVQFQMQVNHNYSVASHVPIIRELEVQSFKVPGIDQDIRIRFALWSSHEALQTARWLRAHQEEAPLLPRTWVYQERMLASRTLHLHSSEMVWICHSKQRCECASLDASPLGGDGWSATKGQISQLGEIKDKKSMYGLWRTIVEDISILDLSFESDRLPALSGLASRFAEHLPENERYLAGLWEGDLLRDLLWESGGAQQVDGPTREKRAGAPSWSWASLSWGGEHPSGLDWEYETKPKLAKWAGTTSYVQDPRARVVAVDVQVQGKNKYGTVVGGVITIEGALCGIMMGPTTQEKPPEPVIDVVMFQESEFNSLHLNFDTPQFAKELNGGIVYCIFIGAFLEVFDDPDEPHVQLCGLMLRPSHAEGKFERIGRWKQYIEHWTNKKKAWTKKARITCVDVV